jgi:hypothetical protein
VAGVVEVGKRNFYVEKTVWVVCFSGVAAYGFQAFRTRQFFRKIKRPSQNY